MRETDRQGARLLLTPGRFDPSNVRKGFSSA